MHIILKAAFGCALLTSAGAMAQTTGDTGGGMTGPTSTDHASPHPNAPGSANGNTLGSPAVQQNRDSTQPPDASGSSASH